MKDYPEAMGDWWRRLRYRFGRIVGDWRWTVGLSIAALSVCSVVAMFALVDDRSDARTEAAAARAEADRLRDEVDGLRDEVAEADTIAACRSVLVFEAISGIAELLATFGEGIGPLLGDEPIPESVVVEIPDDTARLARALELRESFEADITADCPLP